MAAAMGMGMAAGGSSFSSSSSSYLLKMKKKNNKNNNNNNKVKFVSASATEVADPYGTLRINRDASESDVKKAFRRLALQYHPDVCRGDNCTVKFQQINEAYDIVLNNLRGDQELEDYYANGGGINIDEPFRGMNDDAEWDLWEEWMGWEGAGIRDYSSHINPYI